MKLFSKKLKKTISLTEIGLLSYRQFIINQTSVLALTHRKDYEYLSRIFPFLPGV
jgi:hypothetical protein